MNVEMLNQQMVDSQLRVNDVADARLIDAMARLDRRKFVGRSVRALAYADTEIPQDQEKSRYLWRASHFAKLAKELAIQPSDILLDIAPGSGYSSAVFKQLAQIIVAVENVDIWVARLENLSQKFGGVSLHILHAELQQGAPQHGPFDVIFCNIPVAFIPLEWEAQLAETGRIGVLFRTDPMQCEARIYTKKLGTLSWRTLFEFNLPLPTLGAKQAAEIFSF